jgi:hypothetical protein
MNSKSIYCAVAFVFVLVLAGIAAAQNSYRISAPHTYKNLTIFLIHGKDESSGKNVLTLQEAMEMRVLRVYETSDVNELEVENISKVYDVFIQSGDIVKGGKQDRVLAVSIMIRARSGRISIDAFCVESGRWEKRKGEEVGQFSSSNDRLVTKDLKLAANKSSSQQEVWAKVSEAQTRLARNVGGSVAAADSATSLQLSLENRKVTATSAEYIRNLQNIINGRNDVIGYAFAINGKLNSADIYSSNALFKKLWGKMLKATTIEAVAELNARPSAAPAKAADVNAFLTDSDRAKAEEKRAAGGARIVTREDRENVMFEARDERSRAVVHRSYVKKN